MVLRRKDGNVYVLEGPNPIVKDQVAWDPDGLVFHNFSWDEVTFVRAPSKAGGYRPREETIKHADPPPPPPPRVPRAETVQHDTPHAPEAARTEKAVSEPPRDFDLPYIKYKVLCHCLPARVKTHEDKLYGESWQKVSYGGKFVFPCVVVESGDTEMTFWTSDPRGQIGEKSIVYPFSYEVHNTSTDSYERVPYDEYRWWKVSDKEPREGGWSFRCVPSDIQPDFSD